MVCLKSSPKFRFMLPTKNTRRHPAIFGHVKGREFKTKNLYTYYSTNFHKWQAYYKSFSSKWCARKWYASS